MAGPAVPRDLTDRQPGSLAAAMPEGLMTVVAGDGDAAAWDAPDEAWVHVGADGSITAFTGKVDAGQGTRTALGLLVAEELAVPPSRVTVTMADTCASPFDLGTFGSRSMPHAAPPLRTAAAAAFRLLRDAAAARFGLRPDELTAADGMFAGPDGAPVAGYGELVAGQRRVERVPAGAPVTPAAQWRTAGRTARAAGGLDVVTGAKRFPSDLRLDGMLHGCVLHPPGTGARLAAADTSAAAALPGVVVVRDGGLTGIVAPDRRTACRALAAITANWHEAAGPAAAELESWLRARPSDGDGRFGSFRHDRGDAAGALAAGPVRVQASFRAAYVAHVPLEPRAALARWDGDRLTVWTATSTPFRARRELAAEFGLPEADVHVLVPDFGGGFGGKHGAAVATEAARLARAAGPAGQGGVDQGGRVHGRVPAAGRVHRGRRERGRRRPDDRLVAAESQFRRGRDHDPVPGAESGHRLPAGRGAAGPGFLPGAGRDGEQLRPRVAHGRAGRRRRRGSGPVPA